MQQVVRFSDQRIHDYFPLIFYDSDAVIRMEILQIRSVGVVTARIKLLQIQSSTSLISTSLKMN